MWHFDASTFGGPNNDLSQTQSDQFQRLSGDVGSGQFKAYNPTGPIPVDLSFTWTGTQLGQFRSAWDDQNQINKGANWFTADLPLMLNHDVEANTTLFPYNTSAQMLINLTLGGTSTTFGFRSNFFGTSRIGEISSETIMGENFGLVAVFAGSDTFVVRLNSTSFGGGDTLRGNPDKITAYFPNLDLTLDLPFGASSQDYRVVNADVSADWEVSAGQERLVILTMNVQPFQRYRVHTTTPYSADMIGYDAWRVTLPVEVDVSPELILS